MKKNIRAAEFEVVVVGPTGIEHRYEVEGWVLDGYRLEPLYDGLTLPSEEHPETTVHLTREGDLMDRHVFTVGGLIRVLVHEPDNSPIPLNSVVTIKRLGLTEVDGSSEPYAVVSPGDYRILLRWCEPVAMHDNIHPDVTDLTDDEVNTFEDIIDLDPLLRHWIEKSFIEVAESLGEEVDDGLPPSAPVDGTVGLLEAEPQKHSPNIPPERRLGYTDPDGDDVEILYGEFECDDHGLEAMFRFVINEREAVDFPVEYLGPVLRFIQRWSKHYFDEKKRRGEPLLPPPSIEE